MTKKLNRCTFIGNLVRDPVARALPDGTPGSSFTIAVQDDYKKDGQKVEHAEFVPLTVVGKLAEICNQYLKKGKEVYVEGKFAIRKYQKDGEDKYVTEIKLESMLMLGGRDDSSDAARPPGRRSPSAPPPYFDDEIPF